MSSLLPVKRYKYSSAQLAGIAKRRLECKAFEDQHEIAKRDAAENLAHRRALEIAAAGRPHIVVNTPPVNIHPSPINVNPQSKRQVVRTARDIDGNLIAEVADEDALEKVDVTKRSPWWKRLVGME